jgi:hypothetical protein
MIEKRAPEISFIDELKPLYENLIKGDVRPIRKWINENPQKAQELVNKYLNIIKSSLNITKSTKARLKVRVKRKKGKKTRKKKKRQKRRKVKSGGAEPEPEPGPEPEPEPGTEDDICGICLERLELTGKLRGEELLKCCGEIYHAECLEKVTGPCPSCRAPLTRGNRSPSPPPRRTRTRTRTRTGSARGPSPTRHPNTLQGETRQGENHWWENMMIPLISSILYFIFARGTDGDEEP